MAEAEGSLHGLTVGYFGHHDPAYPRNRILAKALRRAGAGVVAVTDPRPFLARTPRLLAGAARLPLDLLLVGFPGHADVAAARALGRAKGVPVLFDAFVSLWETAQDRGMGSRRALRYRLEDRLACRMADLVLVDSDAHRDLFVEDLGVPRSKLRTVRPGADDELLRPLPRDEGTGFRVLFCGSYIPLHGVDTIVRAAKVLEDGGEAVEMVLIGNGQTFASVRALATRLGVGSVRFAPRVPAEDLSAAIARSDVCLGIFGATPKAGRVIPNKVFDALAMARPVVTGDTPAAREVLDHGETAWLCPPADPQALAAAIRALRADPAAQARLAAAGHRLFLHRFSIDALSATIAGIVRELVPPAG